MTTTEKLELMKVMDKHNADAIAALKQMDEEIAARRAKMNEPIGWRVQKVKRSRAELADIAARMARPMTRAERAKLRRDREIIRQAYELDAKAYAPTPLQQRYEIAMTLIWMWRQGKKRVTV